MAINSDSAAFELSLKRKAISTLDFDAILLLDTQLKAAGIGFDECVSIAREVRGMSREEMTAMAKEEIAYWDSVIEEQKEQKQENP